MGVEKLPYEEQLCCLPFTFDSGTQKGYLLFTLRGMDLHPLLTSASIISYSEIIKVKNYM